MPHRERLRQRLHDVPATVVDAAVATGIVAVTAWMGRDYQLPGFREFDGTALVLTCLANIPLAARRRAPMTVLLTCCTVVAWFLTLGYVPSLNLFGPLLAMYTVAATRPTRTALPGAAATAGVTFYSGMVVEVYTLWTALAQALVATLVAWLFGAGARRLADRNRRLLALAEELRREREARARSAVLAERIRIARELHDVVAHHMSVISVQAGLARYVLATDPATVGAALDTITDSSHEALEEMRRMLALLRVSDADPRGEGDGCDPAPGLGRLDELVERIRAAGVQVAVVVVGSPRPLPPGTDLCAYRVAQESLTNVLKHARGARANVTLDYGQPERLTIRVADDGPGAPDGPAHGHGLAGMRERARLYGGSLHAGTAPGGGFTVTLSLPVGVVPPGRHEPGVTGRRPSPPARPA
ncbi:sensor histidine kinase [Micromonospora sp. DT46]|uniref:sensor histidine kinase n=1 Tax=unclassified Micromonospora TaxID=2617518 RepID=UPI001CECF2C9|nr:sensor histidine kinase [Micromonospora sp. AMSO12t]